MISHRNLVSCCLCSGSKITLSDQDVYLSYLPMAHVLERLLFYNLIWYGSKIGVY